MNPHGEKVKTTGKSVSSFHDLGQEGTAANDYAGILRGCAMEIHL